MINSVSENKLIPCQRQKESAQSSKNLSTISSCPLVLSPRERQVAHLILEDNSAREIAEMLFISPKTAEQHIYHMKKKLGCSKKSALIKKLIQLLNG